jgi:Na+/H+-translocating membrane pyrophosphatase
LAVTAGVVLFGAEALGGFLAGLIVSEPLLAVYMSNAGGAWDNAKKLNEDELRDPANKREPEIEVVMAPAKASTAAAKPAAEPQGKKK